MIIFPSRDGYLLQKIYVALTKKKNSCYLLTSRRLVSVAAMENENDIKFALKRSFSCSFTNLMVERFGIFPDADDEHKDIIVDSRYNSDILQWIMRYKHKILKNAYEEKKNYLKYLASLGLMNPRKRCAFFDFVSKGTTQFYLEKITERKLDGIYFATVDLPNEFYQEHDISSFLGNPPLYYSNEMSLYQFYLFLEVILTSPMPQLEYCNDDGIFCYSDKIASFDFSKIEECHSGICQFIDDLHGIPFIPRFNLKLLDHIYGVMFKKGYLADNSILKHFVMDCTYDCEPNRNLYDELKRS